MEERHANRNVQSDLAVGAGSVTSASRHPASQDVCFNDKQTSIDSEVSSVSMPGLHVDEQEDTSPPPRLSVDSKKSSTSSRQDKHEGITDSQMAQSDRNLMKHTSRRNSPHEPVSTTDVSQRRNSTGAVDGHVPRQKAYSFDDPVVPVVQTKPPTQPISAPPPKIESAHVPVKTAPVQPTIIQGRVCPTPISMIQSGPAHGNIMKNATPGTTDYKLSAPSLDNNRSLSNVTACPPQGDASLGMLYPDSLRKRAVPDRHMVVLDEVDHGLLMESDKGRLTGLTSHGDIGALLKLKNDKHDEKDDTWNKVAELSLFALSGFGFFETKLGTGTYSREKKASIIRQSQTDKDWL